MQILSFVYLIHRKFRFIACKLSLHSLRKPNLCKLCELNLCILRNFGLYEQEQFRNYHLILVNICDAIVRLYMGANIGWINLLDKRYHTNKNDTTFSSNIVSEEISHDCNKKYF